MGVLQGTSGYFDGLRDTLGVVLVNSGYFKVLLGTSVTFWYFEVFQVLWKYFEVRPHPVGVVPTVVPVAKLKLNC